MIHTTLLEDLKALVAQYDVSEDLEAPAAPVETTETPAAEATEEKTEATA